MPDTLKTFYQKYAELSDITDTLKTFYNTEVYRIM